MGTQRMAILIILFSAYTGLQSMDNNEGWLIPIFQDAPQAVMLEENETEGTALQQAVRQGLNSVREFLDNGGDVNAGGGIGLFEAVSRGDQEIIDLLIQRGIAINEFATNALEIAVEYDRENLVPRLLLEYGADADPAILRARSLGRQDLVAIIDQYNIEPIPVIND